MSVPTVNEINKLLLDFNMELISDKKSNDGLITQLTKEAGYFDEVYTMTGRNNCK